MHFTSKDLDRFLSSIQEDPETGCHLWVKAISVQGYGRFWINGRRWPAHVIAWIRENGLIETEYTLTKRGTYRPIVIVRHTCDVRNCVNPEHLLLGTDQDNSDDKIARSRQRWSKTHCPQGHLFTEASIRYNTRPGGTLSRSCRICERKRYKPRTQCPKGHLYDKENTLYDTLGRVYCKKCSRKTHCIRGHRLRTEFGKRECQVCDTLRARTRRKEKRVRRES